MAESADALDSGSSESNFMRVQVPSSAPQKTQGTDLASFVYEAVILDELMNYLMSKIGGPRCCKRNAYLSIINAVVFVKEKYDIKMEIDNKICEFSDLNKQCIKEKCPFYKG